jgi:hypothetical protein
MQAARGNVTLYMDVETFEMSCLPLAGQGGQQYDFLYIISLFVGWWLVLVLTLICCERKILLNDWLILTDKFKRTG